MRAIVSTFRKVSTETDQAHGSLSATIIKSMKRAMAGEYSRELSVKVFAGQCRLIGLGFRQGGLAGYGLRRQLVDEKQQPKCELAIGTQKSLQTDRVVLVPGPVREVDNVRRMYRMFVEEGHSEQAIATAFNEESELTDLKRFWTRGSVHQVLTNEKYVGNNLYNRTSFKLKQKHVVNPPEMWIRADGAFQPVVERATFERVRQIIAERSRRFTNSDMLTQLAVLLKDVGRLSGLVIDERENMPSSAAYRSRFGSLLRAYTLVGYSPIRDYGYMDINRALRKMHPQVVADTVGHIEAGGGSVSVNASTDLLTVNNEFTASIAISRCVRLASGALRWNIRLDTGLRPDITLAIRMDIANERAFDYYLLPRLEAVPGTIRLREENGLSLDAFRFESLDAFFNLAARMPIGDAA